MTIISNTRLSLPSSLLGLSLLLILGVTATPAQSLIAGNDYNSVSPQKLAQGVREVQPSGDAPLTMGNNGDRVTQVQQRLKALGYFPGEVTGYFGEVTRAAIINFQRDRDLTADGIVGNSTFAALNRPQDSEKVKEIQRRLQTAGFYQGAIDGIWGVQSQAALEAAQRAFNINPADLK